MSYLYENFNYYKEIVVVNNLFKLCLLKQFVSFGCIYMSDKWILFNENLMQLFLKSWMLENYWLNQQVTYKQQCEFNWYTAVFALQNDLFLAYT